MPSLRPGKVRNESHAQRNPLHPQRARIACPRSGPPRRCSTICGCAVRCAAPRKAAPRAIAAPAPCWSAGCTGGKLVYESVNACIRFLGSLDGCHVVTVEHLQRATARCIRCSRRWSTSTARNAASARRASSCRSTRCGCGRPEPADAEIEKALQGNLCRCTGYEAIVRAARAISSYGKAAKDPLVAERKADHAQGSRRCDDGSRVEIGAGKTAADRAGSVDDLADAARRRAAAPRSSPARPMSACG